MKKCFRRKMYLTECDFIAFNLASKETYSATAKIRGKYVDERDAFKALELSFNTDTDKALCLESYKTTAVLVYFDIDKCLNSCVAKTEEIDENEIEDED